MSRGPRSARGGACSGFWIRGWCDGTRSGGGMREASQVRRNGLTRQQGLGVRVFTDHGDEPAPEPAELGGLLAAEREAGGRDPYRRVAALLHLVYGQGRTNDPANK